MPAKIYKDKKKVTMEDFDNWLSECPVPYEQTCNGLNTTEHYSFNLINCEMKSEEDDDTDDEQANEQKG
jgi:hypothetical protein